MKFTLLNRQQENLTEKENKFEDEKQVLLKQTEDLAVEISVLVANASKLAEEKICLEKEYQEATSQIAELIQDQQSTQEKINVLDKHKIDLEAKLESQKVENEKLQSQANAHSKKLQEEIETYLFSIETLNKQVAEKDETFEVKNYFNSLRFLNRSFFWINKKFH